MTDDEITRFLVLAAEFQSIQETGAIWLDLGMSELSAAATKLDAMFDSIYADMDVAFWDLASHYDGGWDILRESCDTPENR